MLHRAIDIFLVVSHFNEYVSDYEWWRQKEPLINEPTQYCFRLTLDGWNEKKRWNKIFIFCGTKSLIACSDVTCLELTAHTFSSFFFLHSSHFSSWMSYISTCWWIRYMCCWFILITSVWNSISKRNAHVVNYRQGWMYLFLGTHH